MNALNLRSLALASLLLGLFSGCIVAPGPRYHQSRHPVVYQQAPASYESCPPGHRWSDGRCHETGKGHDPDKHHGKRD